MWAQYGLRGLGQAMVLLLPLMNMNTVERMAYTVFYDLLPKARAYVEM